MKNKFFDFIVIGGGIIGLSIGRELSLSGLNGIILEKNRKLAHESSFRNSAVIHAGIYYEPTSLKAQFCHSGRILLLQYCKMHQIPYQQKGKLIVIPTKKQLSSLKELFVNAKKNKVSEIEMIDQATIRSLESSVNAYAAIFSSGTAIIDGSAFIQQLVKDIKGLGSSCLTEANFLSAEKTFQGFKVRFSQQYIKQVETRFLINAAGLQASLVAKNIFGQSCTKIPVTYFAKGSYFKLLTSKSPFQHLIYPMPETHGLGIHATTDLQGVTRFGPDVEWVDKIDYSVSPEKKASFYKAILNYYSSIQIDALIPEFSGIRPKLKCHHPQDFVIQDERQHQTKGLIHLFGIESPGLTSALAIAQHVKACLF